MNTSPRPRLLPRPWPITTVCLLGAAAGLVAVALLTTSFAWAVEPSAGQRVAGLAAVAAALISLFGYWRMRRWAVALVAVLFAARIVYGLVRPAGWSVAGLVGPVLLLVLGAAYWKRMA